jgi:NAD/NADP transhydrogenase beta subunit
MRQALQDAWETAPWFFIVALIALTLVVLGYIVGAGSAGDMDMTKLPELLLTVAGVLFVVAALIGDDPGTNQGRRLRFIAIGLALAVASHVFAH